MTTTIAKLEEPILVDGLTWREFKAVEQLLDRRGVRLSFLDGVLEIQRRPGEQHETVKERIGTLLDIYLLHLGIDYTPTGSMTLESETKLVKGEADKSYKLGANRSRPDLAIEVVVTSGGINKLEAYRRLKIPEVWFWEDGTLSIHHLRTVGNELIYEQITTSEELPGLDISLLLKCINISNHLEAVRTFQIGIRS